MCIVKKTSIRSALRENTLDIVMRININGPHLDDFEANSNVLKWMVSTKTAQHIEGHSRYFFMFN